MCLFSRWTDVLRKGVYFLYYFLFIYIDRGQISGINCPALKKLFFWRNGLHLIEQTYSVVLFDEFYHERKNFYVPGLLSLNLCFSIQWLSFFIKAKFAVVVSYLYSAIKIINLISAWILMMLMIGHCVHQMYLPGKHLIFGLSCLNSEFCLGHEKFLHVYVSCPFINSFGPPSDTPYGSASVFHILF